MVSSPHWPCFVYRPRFQPAWLWLAATMPGLLRVAFRPSRVRKGLWGLMGFSFPTAFGYPALPKALCTISCLAEVLREMAVFMFPGSRCNPTHREYGGTPTTDRYMSRILASPR